MYSHQGAIVRSLSDFDALVDLNHVDMKFLRDLKLLSDLWYRRYVSSRTSDTNTNIAPVIDEEQDHEDEHELRVRSITGEDQGLDGFSDLLDSMDSQSTVSEQRRQAYL